MRLIQFRVLLVFCDGSEEAVVLKGAKYNLKWKEKISIKTPKDT